MIAGKEIANRGWSAWERDGTVGMTRRMNASVRGKRGRGRVDTVGWEIQLIVGKLLTSDWNAP